MRIYSAQNFLKQSARTAGFTLIELLVVIGILGILAAALIATIDPFEQLKKANDANVENAMIEFINANIRYYTIHNAFPWDGSGGTDCLGLGGTDNDMGFVPLDDATAANDLGTMEACVQDLIDNGELKASFSQAEGILSQIYVREANDAITACYDPGSKAKTEDDETVYVLGGASPNATMTSDPTQCAGGTGSGTDCFTCSQG